jgi:hypothetical protein
MTARPGAGTQRVALYCRLRGPAASARAERRLAQLRDHALNRGWEVVAEYVEPSSRTAGTAGRTWSDLVAAITGGGEKPDLVLVPSVAEAFPSVSEAARALTLLAKHEVGFCSYEEPSIDTSRYPAADLVAMTTAWGRLERASAAKVPDREVSATDAGSDGFQRDLARLFQLQARALEKQETEAREQASAGRLRSRLGHVVTWIFLLTAYSAIVAAGSSAALGTALIDPKQASDLTGQGVAAGVKTFDAVPAELRAILLPLLGSLALLILRSISMNILTNVGGILVAGLLTATLLGLAAGAATPPLGTLAAVPGFLAAAVVFYEMGLIMAGVEGRRKARRRDGLTALIRGLARPYAKATARFLELMHPVRGPGVAAAFFAMPILAVVLLLTSITLFGLSQHPLLVAALWMFVIWSFWGVAVTPAIIRLPLWSMPVWAYFLSGYVVVAVMTDGKVSLSPTGIIFGLAVVFALISNAGLAALLWPQGARSQNREMPR